MTAAPSRLTVANTCDVLARHEVAVEAELVVADRRGARRRERDRLERARGEQVDAEHDRRPAGGGHVGEGPVDARRGQPQRGAPGAVRVQGRVEVLEARGVATDDDGVQRARVARVGVNAVTGMPSGPVTANRSSPGTPGMNVGSTSASL